MGFFDGTSSSPDVSYPPSAPVASGAPSPVPSYQDYLAAVNKAAALNSAQAPQHPGLAGLYSWMSGGQRDAAQANAALSAPENYFKMQAGQSGAQGGQLDVGQVLSFMNRFRQAQGQPPIDPNNIPGAFAPQGQPGAQPQAPSAPPQMGAPSGPPTQTPPVAPPNAGGQPAMPGPPPMPGAQFLPPNAGPNAQPPVNPADALRSQYVGMANSMIGLPKFATQALDYTKLAREGLPPQTVPLLNGQVGDSVTGKPINMSAQDYAAQGAGKVGTAQGIARAGTTLTTGVDKNTGLPVATSELNVLQGKQPSFSPGPNPFFAGQQEELKGLRSNADDADQGLQLALQVQNAANGIYTGKGAGHLQDARKLAQAASRLTGVTLPDSINNDTSQFEQLKFAGQQLVAKASHNLSPRIAQNIYQQINAVKPGDATSVQGLRDIISKEIIPALGRQKAMFGATSDYYKANPMTNNAQAVVPGKLNIGDYAVQSDLSKVKPGGYFVDPKSGNIRQRPVQ